MLELILIIFGGIVGICFAVALGLAIAIELVNWIVWLLHRTFDRS